VRLAWPDLRLAQGALLVGLGVLVVAWRLRDRGPRGALSEHALRGIVLGASVVSAGLSVGWIVEVLRGAPRVIDATTYVLEARVFAAGAFGFDAGELPTRAAGRFLVRDVAAAGAHLSPIFPPGYPAVLAPFVALGWPLALGPLLAAAIPWPTASLARRLARRGGLGDDDARFAAALAAVLVAVSGALRFHTAETMSHGLGALLGPSALAGSLAWVDRGAAIADRASADDRGAVADRSAARIRAAIAIGVGLALGLLVATRPFTGTAFALACALVVGRTIDRAGHSSRSRAQRRGSRCSCCINARRRGISASPRRRSITRCPTGLRAAFAGASAVRSAAVRSTGRSSRGTSPRGSACSRSQAPPRGACSRTRRTR